MTWSRIHILVFAVWALSAAGLALGLAGQGAERSRLERNRGADRRVRLDLDHEHERLRLQVEELSHRAHIAAAVRRLDLPIEAPIRVVSSGPAGTRAREDGHR